MVGKKGEIMAFVIKRIDCIMNRGFIDVKLANF